MTLKRITRGPVLWIVIAVLILWIGASALSSSGTQRIDTSDGLELIRDGKVDQAKITEGSQRVDLTLTEDFISGGENYGKNVQLSYVVPQGPTVVEAIADADPDGGYTSEVPTTSWWSSLLTLVLPFVIILGLFWFLMSSMQGGGS
ncbi:MAG TPA: ATP-dependent metallopeptidase FtsH/Yme1/Tma family protein, partial [Cellulomonas sp.]